MFLPPDRPMSAVSVLLIALLAALLGAVPVFLTLRSRTAQALAEQEADFVAELAAARERVTSREAECARLREALLNRDEDLAASQAVIDTLRIEHAQLVERASRLPQLEAQRVAAEQARATREQDVARLMAELSELRTRLEGERNAHDDKLQTLNDARSQMGEQFKNLANELLEEKSRRFTEQNQQNIGALLGPLKDKLGEFQKQVSDSYARESKERFSLQQEVMRLADLNRQISEDAVNLTRALKGGNKTQGNWGEVVLESVLESSGLRRGEEYTIQESFNREDGSRHQPDVILQLPEGKQIVIDSKVSLNAYLRYTEADDDAGRALALRQHLDSLHAHIKGLSGKNYHDLYQLKSLDFVLLFVPVEPAFMLAVTSDRNLFSDAYQRNVLLVSPSTLLATLRTIANLWRQEQQTRNAQDIARQAGQLYDKFAGFVGDLDEVGRRLALTQKSYDAARNKLVAGRGNLVRQAERLRELGVKPNKTLPAGLLEAADDASADLPAPDALDD